MHIETGKIVSIEELRVIKGKWPARNFVLEINDKSRGSQKVLMQGVRGAIRVLEEVKLNTVVHCHFCLLGREFKNDRRAQMSYYNIVEVDTIEVYSR